jgi:hypothetical protein
MIRRHQEVVILALLMLAAGCTQEQQPQPDVSPSSKPSAKSTPVKEAPLASQSLPKAESKEAPLASKDLPKAESKEAPLASEGLPKAGSNGDYSGKTSHQKWIVVDPDPEGVNCRWSEAMPTSWYAPDTKLPALTISQWPVVRRFTKDTSSQNLTANTTPAGFVTINDESGKPWLKVNIGSNDRICLVRANSKYVQPVR